MSLADITNCCDGISVRGDMGELKASIFARAGE